MTCPTSDDSKASWIVVSPPVGTTDESNAVLLEPYGPPRIWASVSETHCSISHHALTNPPPPLQSKEELLDVVPALKNEVNGVVWGNVAAPVLFLQGPAWPGDHWDGQRAINVAMYVP